MDLSTLMPQQKEIVTTLDRPLFVSAGAGSGKTFTLTRRILWALSAESGPFAKSLDEILAITFTKDAAAEIRERVRAALVDEGMADEALAVDDAWISTIHGMCSRILREHALELGIDPEFSVLEDTDELMDAAVDRVVAAAGEGAEQACAYGHLRAWYPLRGEKGSDGREAGTSASKLVRRLLELSCALPHGMADISINRGYLDFSGMADMARAIKADFPRSKAAVQADEILAALDTFDQSPREVADVVRCLLSCPMPRAQGKAKETVNMLKAEAAEAFVNAFVACGHAAIDELMQLAASVEAEYRALKDERSLLDNNDLLRLTYEALRDNASIRDAYAHRFKLVMIDEFQDTDQQQVDLISFLTGEGGRALCTVGDAQQSIYRFRGAEVEVFRRAEASIAAADPTCEDGCAGASRAACVVDSDGCAAPDQSVRPLADSGPAAGKVVRLIKNFRSHEEVLSYVARIFDGGSGGLMRGFLDLQAHGERKDSLIARTSRRSAFLVVGGTTEERTQAKAAAIAQRFRALADAGQPVGDMVLLLGGMTRADVYADAIRAEGLDCVIAGGSVFSSTPEVAAVRALVCALANPLDTAQGLMPLLASPLFALGVQEFLALATSYDASTGETRRRNLDAGIFSDEDAPGLEALPLVLRAREVLRAAWRRVGVDPFSRIARDVVNESGWFVRLAARGPQGRAVAANVLKALDALADAEDRVGNAPRGIMRAFDTYLAGKQAPGALNEQGGSAVRIMTVHASKGLEFPVVAVSECFSVRTSSERFQVRRASASVDAVALPAIFSGVKMPDGSFVGAAEVKKAFDKLLKTVDAGMVDDVCATGSALAGYLAMCDGDRELDLAERARLLYVAMTRAREVCILAMDESVGTGAKAELSFKPELDLTGAVLERILPGGAQTLACDRLAFDNAQAGDFELIALKDFSYNEERYAARAVSQDTCAPDGCSDDAQSSVGSNDRVDGVQVRGDEEETGAEEEGALDNDTFTLVWPAAHPYRLHPAPPAPRASYSYSSLAAAGADVAAEERSGERLPAERAGGEETLPPCAPKDLPSSFAGRTAGAGNEDVADGPVRDAADPTALGSAFHAAAQWLIETGGDRVPKSRLEALARYWGVTPQQRVRLEAALGRWYGSAARAELRSWPCVRAEVPFFSLGLDDEEIRTRFGVYAEGAIDALATDPDDAARALVVDYKTGGSAEETREQLQEKHSLQARVYADVLHRAGYRHVTLRFVRVEIEDACHPGEPQVVSYDL